MATANPISETGTPSARAAAGLMVLMVSVRPEQLEAVLANLAVSFPSESLLIAGADGIATESYPNFTFFASPTKDSAWILTASDFVNAFELARKNEARAILMLGAECASLSAAAMRDLATPVLGGSTDLAIPYYELPRYGGLVNSAILYPLSRALFSSSARYPLAVDLGLSLRMAERIAANAQRFLAQNQEDAPLWPVNEVAVAGFGSRELDVGRRKLPQPADPDLNTILPLMTGSLFSDIDAKAAYWQRTRPASVPRTPAPSLEASDSPPDTVPMIEGFRLAFTNLRDIWSLVLPPNTLLGLKRLSVAEPAAFRMPDGLWARIVYDFLLAYRLRTINRGHLLGALIPLYLAWVASHINISNSGIDSERHIQAVAAAFETEKPYLVSRWRWPDRFSP